MQGLGPRLPLEQAGRTRADPPRVRPRSKPTPVGVGAEGPQNPQLAPLLWGGPVARRLESFPRSLSHANEWFLCRSFPVNQVSHVCLTSVGPLKTKALGATQSTFPEREGCS